MDHYGILTIVPTVFVLLIAITTRRSIEALLAGSIVGVLIIDPANMLSLLTEKSLAVLTDGEFAWVVLVCGLMGSLIALLIRTGASASFVRSVSGVVKSRVSALMVAWGLGLALFVDDYLNSLAVGSAMRDVTDKFKTPRELLAYVIDSTAAPISVIIPISTWAVFFGVLLEDAGVAAEGQGIWMYIQAIPYMFYAWIAAFMVPLVILEKIPLLGPMKKAVLRAEQTAECIPPGAEHITQGNETIREKSGVRSSIWLFIIPMLSLIFFTWFFDLDFLKGIYITLTLSIVAITIMRSLGFNETFDTIIDGFKTMIEPLAVLACAFLLKEVNDILGLSEFIIAAVEPLVSAELLPLIIFLVMGFVSFATGSNWGVFVIIIPVVTALANSLEADMVLVIGATLSASTFGSHACFYSDATVLTAQASGCTPFQHAYTQFPYALIAAGMTALGYIILAIL